MYGAVVSNQGRKRFVFVTWEDGAVPNPQSRIFLACSIRTERQPYDRRPTYSTLNRLPLVLIKVDGRGWQVTIRAPHDVDDRQKGPEEYASECHSGFMRITVRRRPLRQMCPHRDPKPEAAATFISV